MIGRRAAAGFLLVFSLLASVVGAEEAENSKNSTLLGSCKENEQWEKCTHCERHCEGGEVCPDNTDECRYPVCRCVEGYSRDDSGACIPISSCPATGTSTTSKDQAKTVTIVPKTTTVRPSLSTIISLITKMRPEKKGESTPQPAPQIVVSVTKIASAVAAEALAVKPPLKAPAGGCGANEEMTDCGECEATCTHRSRECVRDYCKQPRCQCKKGFVRNPYGSCVTPSGCNAILYRAPKEHAITPLPATVPSRCNRDCAEGYMCVLGPRVFVGPGRGYQIYPICISTKFRKYYSNM